MERSASLQPIVASEYHHIFHEKRQIYHTSKYLIKFCTLSCYVLTSRVVKQDQLSELHEEYSQALGIKLPLGVSLIEGLGVLNVKPREGHL